MPRESEKLALLSRELMGRIVLTYLLSVPKIPACQNMPDRCADVFLDTGRRLSEAYPVSLNEMYPRKEQSLCLS